MAGRCQQSSATSRMSAPGSTISLRAVRRGRLGHGRIVVNTVLGVASGLWDVATPMGPRSTTRTSARRWAWGVYPGPYLVIPLLRAQHRARRPARFADPQWYWPRYIDNDTALLEHLRIGQGAPARQPAESGDGARRSPRSTATASFAMRGSGAATRCTTGIPAREGRRRRLEKIAVGTSVDRRSADDARRKLLLVVFFAFLAILVTVIAVCVPQHSRQGTSLPTTSPPSSSRMRRDDGHLLRDHGRDAAHPDRRLARLLLTAGGVTSCGGPGGTPRAPRARWRSTDHHHAQTRLSDVNVGARPLPSPTKASASVSSEASRWWRPHPWRC